MSQATTSAPPPAQAPSSNKSAPKSSEKTIQTAPDGRVIIRTNDSPELAPAAEGSTLPPQIPYDPNAGPPQGAIILSIAFFVCTAAVIIGLPLVRAFARRMDRSGGLPERAGATDPESAQRLARMEQAIDSIALEVERISEGQRFTTKLLSEAPKGVNVERRVGQG